MEIFAIKDDKTGSYSRPTYAVNQGACIRDMKILVNGDDQGNLISQYPEDFNLYRLGSFDQETGVITPKVEFILCLGELKIKETE